MKTVELRPMSEAPKDGSEILIMWDESDSDLGDVDIGIGHWWKPTELPQWESGARPQWEYRSRRNDSIHRITKPLGWMPVPTPSETK